MAKRIEIFAPLGIGKTTLAEGLAKYGFHPVLETFDADILQAYYDDPTPENTRRNLDSFVQHEMTQCDEVSTSNKPCVLDYSGAMARAYVDISDLGDDDKHAMQAERDALDVKAGKPDLVIVLKLDVDKQMQRIQQRARPEEKAVSREFVEALNAAGEKRLALLPPDVKRLTIDADAIDYRKPHEIKKIAQRIDHLLGTKQDMAKK